MLEVVGSLCANSWEYNVTENWKNMDSEFAGERPVALASEGEY